MKRLSVYLFVTAIGSLQLAYDIVSAPVMLNVADDKASAYIHDRYERRMANRTPDRTPQDMALDDVSIRATQLCDRNGVVCDYLASVERPVMPARRVLK